jgi:hypothetical protein
MTRTVFWKPDIQLNGEKELRIRFLSPVEVKGYRLIAEGINSRGQLIHYETKILPPAKAFN